MDLYRNSKPKIPKALLRWNTVTASVILFYHKLLITGSCKLNNQTKRMFEYSHQTLNQKPLVIFRSTNSLPLWQTMLQYICAFNYNSSRFFQHQSKKLTKYFTQQLSSRILLANKCSCRGRPKLVGGFEYSISKREFSLWMVRRSKSFQNFYSLYTHHKL